MRLALFAIAAACGSAKPESAPPPVVATIATDAGAIAVAVTDAGEAPPDPSLCGRRSWSQCLAIARHLRDDATRGYPAQAARIYAALCDEGDRRRCFEDDTPRALRGQCAGDGLVDACRELGAMYRDGLARCPSDSACAENLFAMACTAGDDQACTAEAGLRQARGAP